MPKENTKGLILNFCIEFIQPMICQLTRGFFQKLFRTYFSQRWRDLNR